MVLLQTWPKHYLLEVSDTETDEIAISGFTLFMHQRANNQFNRNTVDSIWVISYYANGPARLSRCQPKYQPLPVGLAEAPTFLLNYCYNNVKFSHCTLLYVRQLLDKADIKNIYEKIG